MSELEGTAPPRYVKELVMELEQQLIAFRRQMDVADKQMQASPKLLTEQGKEQLQRFFWSPNCRTAEQKTLFFFTEYWPHIVYLESLFEVQIDLLVRLLVL